LPGVACSQLPPFTGTQMSLVLLNVHTFVVQFIAPVPVFNTANCCEPGAGPSTTESNSNPLCGSTIVSVCAITTNVTGTV
jgi:hypothetical protein